MDKEQELEQLITQMREGTNEEAKQAVEVLREKGWLQDRSLREADLIGADLNGADLWVANLYGANLIGANLIGANLIGANLIEANLTKANLTKARLGGVYLIKANLIEANLTKADLWVANLIGADLNRANLYGADLNRANLKEANLYGTDFSEATCLNTIFADVDLSVAKGLETIDHIGPSEISINTLLRSGGNIPEVFLRGCGVPDEWINYIPSLTGKAIDFYSCFISYNHEDKAFARRVHDTLQGRGIRCWLDEKQMNPGDDIYAEIDRGIRYWDKVLLCCSEHSLRSWWVDNEINKAFEKERQIMKDRGDKTLALIPLDLDGHLFSGDFTSPKKDEIHSRLAADFKGWKSDSDLFDEQIESVIRALRTDGGKETPPPSKL